MANQDFFITFGSNADTFAGKLKAELAPARTEIKELGELLQGLEQQTKKSAPAIRGALAADAARDTGGDTGTGTGTGTGGRVPELRMGKFQDAMDSAAQDISVVVKQVKSLLSILGDQKSPAALRRMQEGQGTFQVRGKMVKTAEVEAGMHPGATRMRPAGEAKLVAALEKVTRTPVGRAPAPSIRTAPQPQVGQAEVERARQAVPIQRARQGALQEEVAAAETAITQAKAAISKMNAAAKAGGEVDVGAYERQTDKLDLATTNLTRFQSELAAATKALGQLEQLAGKPDAAAETGQAPVEHRPVAGQVKIADVSKVQLDKAELDRVVRAVNEVRDEVRNLASRMAAPVAPPTTPPTTPPTPSAAPAAALTEQGKQQVTAPAEPAPAETDAQRLAALEQRLAGFEVKAQKLAAIVGQAGGAVDDALKEASHELDEVISDTKAEIAKLERATTGITKAEQSERRKAEFQAGPDLEDEEFLRRERVRKRLDLALAPEQFREAVGTGAGQLLKDDLIELATQLNKFGIEAPTSRKLNKPELAEGVIQGRQAMLEKFGPEVPAELQTGRRIVADKVSDAVQQILENANYTAAEAAEDFAAREGIRAAEQAGYLPKEPTLRATETTGEGATSLAGQRLSGPIGVPPDMVKGGEYDDEAIKRFSDDLTYGYLEGLQKVQQTALGKAANLATRPGFDYDPYSINVGKEIEGQGEQAVADRQRFRALRQATLELDNLGHEFQNFADAIDENEQFIERARDRLQRASAAGVTPEDIKTRQQGLDQELEAEVQRGVQDWRRAGTELTEAQIENSRQLLRSQERFDATAQASKVSGLKDYELAKLETDPGKIAEAEANIENARREMASSRFRGLQETFEDPVYQAGRRKREIPKAMYEAQLEDIGRRAKETFIADAAGFAIAGSRLAPGTKDTYIRDVPGLMYQGRKDRFGFTPDQDRGQAELTEMNQAWKSFQNAIARQRGTARDVEEGGRPQKDLDKARLRVENKATAFLNQMEKIFGIAPRLEEIVTQTPTGRGTVPVHPLTGQAPFLTPHRMAQMGMNLEVGRGVPVPRPRGFIGPMPEATGPPIPGSFPSTELRSVEPYEFINEENRLAEQRRQAASEKVRAETSRKLTKAPVEERIAEAEATQGGLKSRLESVNAALVAARERAAAATEALAQHEERALNLLSKAEADEYRAAQERAKLADTAGLKADRRFIDAVEKGEAAGLGRQVYQGPIRPPEMGPETSVGNALALAAAPFKEEKRVADAELVAARRDMANLVPSKSNEGLQHEADESAASVRTLKAELDQLPKAIERTKQKITELRAEQKEGAAGDATKATPDVGTQAQRAAAKEAGAELTQLAKEIDRATKLRADLTDKKAQIKAGRAAGQDVSALAAERDAIKGAEGFATRNQLRAMRKRYDQEMAAAVAGGAGGEVPPSGPRVGPGPGGPSGPGGGDGPIVNILREILTAVNGIHKTIQTGVRVAGPDAQAARPVEDIPTAGSPGAAPAPATGSTAVTVSNEEQAVLARGAERRAEAEAKAAQSTQKSTQTEKQRAKEQHKGLELTRAQVREAMNLSNARALLSEAAKKEFETLKRLNQAGAENEKIVEQQGRAYAAMDQEMTRQGVPAAHRKGYAQSLLSDANVRPDGRQGPPIRMNEVEAVARSSQGFRTYTAQVEDAFTQMGNAASADGPFGVALLAMFGKGGFWARIMNSAGTFIIRNFTAGFVFGLTNVLQDVVRQAIETESTFIRVSSALEATGREAGNLRTDLQQISSDYGVALVDVYETAAGLTGLFEDVGDIAGATRVVTQLEAISMGALTAKEGLGALASITGAFGVDAEHVADVLTTIQDRMSVNIEVSAEGIGRIAGLANQIGLSIEEAGVYVSAIAKLTNQTGAAAGEQFSRIIGAMQTGPGRALMIENLPGTGIEEAIGARDYASAINILMENYEGLTDAQKNNITVGIGGQRQAAAINALLSDGTKVIDDIAAAQDARGAADKRAAAIAKQLNQQIKILGTNFVALGQNLVRSGILTFLGLALTGTNKLLSGFNELASRLNDFMDANFFTRMIKNMTGGLLGLLATAWMLRRVFQGLRGTLDVYQKMSSAKTAATAAASGGLSAAAAAGGAAAGASAADRTAAARQAAAARQTRLGAALQARAAQYSAIAASAGFASPGTVGTGAVATSYTRMARATNLGATAADRMGSSMTHLRTSALGANAAMLALVAGLGFAISGIIRQSQAERDWEEHYQGKWGEGRGEDPAKPERDRYVGPSTDAARENMEAYEGGMSRFLRNQEDFWRAAVNPLTSTLGLTKWSEGTSVFTGEAMEKGMGLVPEEESSENDAARRAAFDRIQAIAKRAASGAGATIEEVEAAEKEALDILIARADEIDASDMSAQQKEAAASELEAIEQGIVAGTKNLRLTVQGLNAVNSLSLDSIQRIDALMQALQGSRSAGDQFDSGVKALIGELGLDESSDVRAMIEKAAEGGLAQADLLRINRDLLHAALTSAAAEYEAATDPEKKSEAYEVFLQKLGSYDQVMMAWIEGEVAGATATAEYLRGRGDPRGAASALDDAIQAIGGELLSNPHMADDQRTDLLNRRTQLGQQQTDDRVAAATQENRLALLGERNDLTRADLEVGIAQDTLKITRRKYKKGLATRDAVRRAEEAAVQAEQSRADLVRAQAAAARGTELAMIAPGNEVAVARKALENARQAEADALLAGSTSVEYQQAVQQRIQAEWAYHAALASVDQAKAALTEAYANARGDSVAAAAAARRGAQLALNTALENAGGDWDAPEVINAQAQLVSMNAAYDQSLVDFTQSRYEVSIAVANAAGRTVQAAQLQAKAARAALADALRKSGGKETGETNQARATAISAEAAARDARLQDRLGTIDFQLEMDRITADGAIAMLQHILKTADLTKQQRRDILLKIKGLKDDLRSTLTASGFNIPDQVKLPTAYEVRRSLGVDAYEKNFRNSLTDVSRARSMAIESARGATVGGGGGARSDTPEMVRAMSEVRDAVMANGAQVVNNIEMTNQVLRPQMVEDVARRVVQLINNQTRQGARANSARPKLVH